MTPAELRILDAWSGPLHALYLGVAFSAGMLGADAALHLLSKRIPRWSRPLTSESPNPMFAAAWYALMDVAFGGLLLLGARGQLPAFELPWFLGIPYVTALAMSVLELARLRRA